MFACSSQHYAWLAHLHRIPLVTIDILELRIEPTEFDIERNRNLVGMCRRMLCRNAEQLTPPGTVDAAVLFVNFGIEDYVEDSCASLGRSTFSVVLTDDRGKEWRVDHTEQRVLVQAW
jgi:hypothetical protein